MTILYHQNLPDYMYINWLHVAKYKKTTHTPITKFINYCTSTTKISLSI